ncbi:hypothetical protein COCON_G00057250 [Conger conger]|uniref:Uncharacterized protein n=1 Tax=Conger conger TaxID=82655 RepID=A0A9Q1I2F6_CONCO|nr:hypothetical protein COCON_G00057250 [Conger conger]
MSVSVSVSVILLLPVNPGSITHMHLDQFTRELDHNKMLRDMYAYQMLYHGMWLRITNHVKDWADKLIKSRNLETDTVCLAHLCFRAYIIHGLSYTVLTNGVNCFLNLICMPVLSVTHPL